jgi:hypothetical protein
LRSPKRMFSAVATASGCLPSCSARSCSLTTTSRWGSVDGHCARGRNLIGEPAKFLFCLRCARRTRASSVSRRYLHVAAIPTAPAINTIHECIATREKPAPRFSDEVTVRFSLLVNTAQTRLIHAEYYSAMSDFHERTRPMRTRQEEHGDKTVSPELNIQNEPQRTVTAETAAHSTEGIPAMEATAADQFRFRILACNGLCIDPCDDSPVVEYRIENGYVESRTLEAAVKDGTATEKQWQRLTPEQLSSHIMANTAVGQWLVSRMGVHRLIRACNSSANDGVQEPSGRVAA